MNIENNNKIIIDPDKIAEALGIPWTHYQLPEYFEEGKKSTIDEGSYIFDLFSKNGSIYSLSFHVKQPDSVTVKFSDSYPIIRFQHITRFVYVRYKREVVFESKIDNYYSQLCIGHKGRIVLHLNRSITDYRLSSMCEIEEQEQKEIDERKNVT